MYMMMLVLDNPDRLDGLLDAWAAINVKGVTIAETTGAFRRQVRRGRVHARYAIGSMGPSSEKANYTLWAIVPDDETVQRCLAAAEEILGNLDDPNTGVFAAWPLSAVKGVPDRGKAGEGESSWSG